MKAFTLIELVFVIVIIGILSAIGVSSFKPKHLIDDVNFIQAKIKEAQFLGIGNEHLEFGGDGGDANMSTGCINIEKTSLEEKATNENEVNYKLHVNITIPPTDESESFIICFDAKGRPYENNFTTDTILKSKKIFTFTYDREERNITIEPFTGYARVVY